MSLLDRIVSLEKDAEAFGFKWENAGQIMTQIQSEVREVEERLVDGDRVKLEEEIGDLMHAVFSLCVFCKLVPEVTLGKAIDKFEGRMIAVKELAKQDGLETLENHSFDELMKYWDRAKMKVG